MRKLLILLLLGGISIAGQAQSAQPMDANDCARIFFKALQDKDGATLQSIMAPDFSIISFDGQPLERGFMLQAIEEGLLSVDSGMLSQMRTKNYGDVSIVQGSWSARGQIQNTTFNNDLTYMLVAVREGGSWKVTALQFTPLR